MDVFDLFAKISLDSSEYESGLNAAKNMATGALSVAGGALTAMGVAATAATGALVAGANEVAQYGDNVDKMSQKLGMSAEAYQEWDAIMQHCGTSIDSMSRGMTTLAKAAENDTEAFEQLGISQEQIANMSQEELFAATIEGLQQMEAGTERTVLAQQLLGGSARELGALLNMTAEDTQEMRDRVHELGGVLSDETVAAAAQFQDNLQDMQTAISGLKRGITSDLLPSFNLLMEGFTSMLIGEEGGVEAFSQGFDSMLTTISEVADRAVELIGQIMPVIFDAIVQNIPDFFTFGREIIGNMINGIIENSGAIIGAAESVIQTFLNGIIEAENSQGVNGIIQVLNNIVDMIIRNLPLLLRASQSIVRQIGSGLSSAVRTLVPVIVNIVSELAKSLTDPSTISTMIQAVMDVAMAIGQTLMDALPVIIELIPTILQNLITALTENLPVVLSGIVSLFEMIVSSLPEIITLITDNLPEIIQMIADALVICAPQLIEAAIMLVSILVQNLPQILSALINAAPTILSAILGGWKTVGDGILGALATLGAQIGTDISTWWEGLKTSIKAKWDEFIGSIKTWWDGLLTSIGGWLAGIIEKFIDLGKDIWEWITVDLKDIIDGIIKWFAELPSRIWEWLSNVVKNISDWASDMWDVISTEIPKIIDEIASFFEELPSMALSWGKDMIDSFVEGIWDAAGDAYDAVEGFLQGVADRIGFSEPKTGPLSNFHTYAPDMMDLFAEGIKDNERKVWDQVESSFDFSDKISDASVPTGSMQFMGSASAGMANHNQPVTVVLELDKVKLAETVFQLNKDETQRMGAQLAYV